MNISADWFKEYGMISGHDARTIENITDAGFINHAKMSIDSAYVDECVKFQLSEKAA